MSSWSMAAPEPKRRKKQEEVVVEEDDGSSGGGGGVYWSEDVWGRRLTCPITHQLFADPVMASDGFLYERAALERWFAARRTSPLTNAAIDGVFHAVPTVRAEVDAFLSSLPLERRRVWRRWSRSAAFQATMDALEPALVAAADRAPVAWRRLMHEEPQVWTAWIAPPPEGERVEGTAASLAPPGTAAAQRARRHGWTEEDMANVWHRLPLLAAGVAAPPCEEEEEGGDEDTAAAAAATRSRSSLVFRATRRLMEYVRLTCAGYVMACATAYRCAESGAWAAATAVVRHAEELDANVLVRMMAASFADSCSGWCLIRVLCDRALLLGGGGTSSAAADSSSGSSDSDDCSSDEASLSDTAEEEAAEEERRVLVLEGEDEGGSEYGGEQQQQEEEGGSSHDGVDDMEEEEEEAPPPPPPHPVRAPPPMSLLGPRGGSTQSAENRAFQDAMAHVDRCGAGLFSSEDDGRDGYGTRRGRDRYPRGSW